LIEGGNNGNVITITSDFVNINGFSIKGDDWGIDIVGNNNSISDNNIISRNSIRILSENNTISDNIFDDGRCGIYISSGGSHCISNNVFKNHEIGGLCLEESNGNNILGNTFMNYGIAEFYIGDIQIIVSDNNIISNNTFIAINEGSQYGIYTELGGSNNIIENNTFNGYNRYGIRGGYYGCVQYNDFIDCGTGVLWWFGPNIVNNNFINCNLGITLVRSNNGNIKNNNFINNGQNAFFSTFSLRNTWDKNYWNGPQDSPYVIKGKLFFLIIPWVNFDWHPAQEPYNIGG